MEQTRIVLKHAFAVRNQGYLDRCTNDMGTGITIIAAKSAHYNMILEYAKKSDISIERTQIRNQ